MNENSIVQEPRFRIEFYYNTKSSKLSSVTKQTTTNGIVRQIGASLAVERRALPNSLEEHRFLTLDWSICFLSKATVGRHVYTHMRPNERVEMHV